MEKGNASRGLRTIQEADVKNRVVLLRVDHNVVKKGRIEDAYRIDATLPTLYDLAQRGGRPILMTHVGRPRDKKTGQIACRPGESVAAIVDYLERKLPVRVRVPDLPIEPERGITQLGPQARAAVDELRQGRVDMLYLPNTRWFQGEESKGPEREALAVEMAALADLYVNDAFGSWQAHCSTFDVARHLPAYAGRLLQKELHNLDKVLEPRRPFVAVIAGAKYDTKIGPLKALYDRVDHLILGGVIYNTFLAAKYDLAIAGVSDEERRLASDLVQLDRARPKVLEMPYLVESDLPSERKEGAFRTVQPTQGDRVPRGYLLDVDPRSLDESRIKDVLASAGTIFVNAVMGFTPHFGDGSQALYRRIAANPTALKLFAGGDTLQELKRLCPGIYLQGLEAPDYYFFTGGGSVLEALAQGDAYRLKPVEVLTAK